MLNVPFRMSGADVSAGRHMSVLGEHTQEFLQEAGLTEAKETSSKTAASG